MKRKFFILMFFCIAITRVKAQTYDMRNFADQTSISVTKAPFADRKNVVGSQFLFNDWAGGSVVNSDGVKFTDGQFNFDKITQNLYVKIPDTSANVAFQVDKSQIRSFTITDGVKTYNFEKVRALDSTRLYDALVKGSKYSLYSLVKTKFTPADFQTNGIVSSGNNYDEYKDEYSYFIVTSNGTSHEISLKSKSIKSFFVSEKDKVDSFYKNNANLPVDENFLALLITYLNQ